MMATKHWNEDSQEATTTGGFTGALELKGRVGDIYLVTGIKLDAARFKEVSPDFIQVTHKDRIKYLNPHHIVMIELG
jgi:hypothetical protein